MTTWTKKTVTVPTWSQDSVAAKTWTEDDPNSATWDTSNLVIYLLTEADENLLYQDGELVIINRPQLATWTEDEVYPSSWTKEELH